LAVVAGALLAAAAPAAASPDPEQGFGLNVQSLVTGQTAFPVAQWGTYLGQMSQDGLHVARTEVLWGKIEPSAPGAAGHAYNWSVPDQLIEQLAARGIRWDVVLHGSPRWASVNPNNSYASPTPAHFGDFAVYAAVFAARYGVGGAFWAAHPGLPALPVTTIEIWNEPNTSVHWGAPPDAAAYASLYHQAHDAIKAVNPGMQVLLGGIVWNDDVAYLQAVLAALGPGVSIDGVGSHPYAPTVFSILPNIQRMRNALDAAGRSTVPLMLNELGWPAAYDRPPSAYALQGPVSDASRAATMALTIDVLSRSTCDIDALAIYDLVENENNPQFVESLMGIYRRDGARTQTSAALAAAVARYRALGGKLGPLIPVCGARGAPATQLLGLKLTGAPAAGGCTVTHVSYQGLPLEEAQVHVLAPYRGVKPSAADGTATLCPPKAGSVTKGLRVVAEIPGAAASNVILCSGICRAIGADAACVTQRIASFGSRRLKDVSSRGLAFKVRGCDPQQGGPVRLRAALSLTAHGKKSLKLKRAAIGSGSVSLLPGQVVTLRARLTAAARRAVRHAKRVAVVVQLTAVEAGTKDKATKTVVLR
jgi:hypothetical protein